METWIGILHSIIIEWLIEIDQLLSAYFSLFIEYVFQTVITYPYYSMNINTENVIQNLVDSTDWISWMLHYLMFSAQDKLFYLSPPIKISIYTDNTDSK